VRLIWDPGLTVKAVAFQTGLDEIITVAENPGESKAKTPFKRVVGKVFKSVKG